MLAEPACQTVVSFDPLNSIWRALFSRWGNIPLTRFSSSQDKDVRLHDRDRHVLNVIFEIAHRSVDVPASLPALAHDTGYTASYVEKLVALFRQHGIVRSIRGSRGGYVLARSPEKISVSEILSAGKLTARREPHNESCIWREVDALLAATEEIRLGILARITLADILDERAADHPFLADMLADFRRT